MFFIIPKKLIFGPLNFELTRFYYTVFAKSMEK
jgi:hypothetical protein